MICAGPCCIRERPTTLVLIAVIGTSGHGHYGAGQVLIRNLRTFIAVLIRRSLAVPNFFQKTAIPRLQRMIHCSSNSKTWQNGTGAGTGRVLTCKTTELCNISYNITWKWRPISRYSTHVILYPVGFASGVIASQTLSADPSLRINASLSTATSACFSGSTNEATWEKKNVVQRIAKPNIISTFSLRQST